MHKPWRRGREETPVLQPIQDLPRNRAEAQQLLLQEMITEFLPKPEQARNPMERLQWQTLAATASPLISQLLTSWDAEKGDATAEIVYRIAARFRALEEQYPR